MTLINRISLNGSRRTRVGRDDHTQPKSLNVSNTREIDVRKALVAVVALFVGVSGIGCEAETPEPEAEAEQVDETVDDSAETQQQADDIAADEEPESEEPESRQASESDDGFEYPDFDLDHLSDDQRQELADLALMELCPCEGAEESLHQCMQQEQRCEEADDEVAALVEIVGEADDDADPFERRAEQRADRGGTHQFSLEDVPSKGSADAEVIIVEFADFRCPHCRRAAEGLEEVYEQFGDDVGIFFKNYPVGGQVAEQAARAALAADNQGRFWEMHQLLFDNQRQIDRTQIEQFARQLGLNTARFDQDMQSDEVSSRLAADRREGMEAGVTGTPAIFINGERYTGRYSGRAMSAKVASVLEE